MMKRWLLLPLLVLFVTGLPRPTAAAGADALPALLAAAQPGETIEIDGGIYQGPLVIDKPVTLIGRNWPVIDGGGTGSVVKLAAPGIHLEGFLIRNSGSSLDEENSGVVVEGKNSTIANNRLEETLFGIYLRQASGSVIRGNAIRSMDVDVPRRGDAIRVWYSDDVLLENNRVERGRDVVLWYSSRVAVRGNDVRSGRYGLHFMYCDDAIIENNLLLDNSVGGFMMYSRRIILRHNTIAGNRGPSGYGVGLKDMDDATVVENLFLDNRVGIYLDNSPREVDSIGRIEGNVLGYNDIGVALLPSVRHNRFTGNSFMENHQQVAVEGGGAMPQNEWSVAGLGNYWSDYAGFDAGADGLGDIPYRSDRLFEKLMDQLPPLRLFVFSPAAEAVDFAAKAFPFVRPQPKLIDEFPMMTPVVPVGPPPLPRRHTPAAVWPLFFLILISAGLVGWPWLRFPLRKQVLNPMPDGLEAQP